MLAPSKLHALLLACAICVACRPAPALSSSEVRSGGGAVRARVPAGPGWQCSANDEDQEGFSHRGVKCILGEGVVLNAKLYEVETANARTAELFCMQDWKQRYASLFRLVIWHEAKPVTWRGVPACQVTIEGTTTKGPWRSWELHAPNGRKLLQLSVSGAVPTVKKHQAVIDAWLADVDYDLSVPGQPRR